MTLSVPRMLFAFGRDGFLPAPVGADASSDTARRTSRSSIQTLIVMALAVSGSFEKLAIIANGSILLVYVACCIGVLELRRRGVQESWDAVPRARSRASCHCWPLPRSSGC